MNSASALASSVLPTPVGPRKMNEPIGRLGSFSPARARRTALASVRDRLFLADDALVQRVLHLQQALDLLAGDAHQRDAGPHRDDLGDVLLGDVRSLRCACSSFQSCSSLLMRSRSLRSRSRSSAASSYCWPAIGRLHLRCAATSSPRIASLQAGRRGRAIHAHARRRLRRSGRSPCRA